MPRALGKPVGDPSFPNSFVPAAASGCDRLGWAAAAAGTFTPASPTEVIVEIPGQSDMPPPHGGSDSKSLDAQDVVELLAVLDSEEDGRAGKRARLGSDANLSDGMCGIQWEFHGVSDDGSDCESDIGWRKLEDAIATSNFLSGVLEGGDGGGPLFLRARVAPIPIPSPPCSPSPSAAPPRVKRPSRVRRLAGLRISCAPSGSPSLPLVTAVVAVAMAVVFVAGWFLAPTATVPAAVFVVAIAWIYPPAPAKKLVAVAAEPEVSATAEKAAVPQAGLRRRRGGWTLEQRADREFVLAAVQQHGSALQYASVEQREDRKIVMAAVQRDG